MIRSWMNLRSSLTALAGLACACSVLAQTPIDIGNGEYMLKNDRFPVTGPVTGNQNASVQAGFAAGEIAAASFNIPANWAGVKIKRIQILWRSVNGTAANSQQDSIIIYKGTPANPATFFQFWDMQNDALPDGFFPVMQDNTAFNEFDFAPANPTPDNPDQDLVITGASAFTVGLKFANATDQTNGPSVVSDQGPSTFTGCISGRNWFFGDLTAGGTFFCSDPAVTWRNACAICNVAGVNISMSGNYMIRAVVERVIRNCGVADIATVGGGLGRDGSITADDLIIFLNAFFNNNLAVADIARAGGQTVPDGQLSADDIIAFLASFFAGCP
jgi:hypothetical protein